MCTHVGHTDHDVKVIVTEFGVADMRGKTPRQRAVEVVENCAHPDYRPLLREYVRMSGSGHMAHTLRRAFALHEAFEEKGDMRLAEFK